MPLLNEKSKGHYSTWQEHEGVSPKPAMHLSSIIRGTMAFVLVLSLYLSIRPSTEIDVSGKSQRSSKEAYFLHRWTTHVTEHPIQARDRTGFAEMGLRTRMYARLLRHPSLPSFDIFEEALWPFIPGIRELRRNYLDVKRASLHNNGGKKGIVMSLGYKDIEFAIQFLTMLRDTHKSILPVEIYYYGEEDLPQRIQSYLLSTFDNIRIIDVEALHLFDPALVQLDKKGWALKPFAMVATNLTEVLLADADTVFLTDPKNFFEEPGYKETGTLFFHDRDHYRQGASLIIHDFLKDQLGRRGPSKELSSSAFWKKRGIYQQESGVVVVDKNKIEVFAALLFAAWQNTGPVRDLTTYRVFWGDKESYWLSFELSGFAYHFTKYYAGGIGEEENDKDGLRLCSEHPLHIISDSTASSDEVKDGKKGAKGKLAWFNGSIYQAKRKEDGVFIQPSRWAMQGEWEFLEEQEMWCLRNYTAFDTAKSQLGTFLPALLKSATKNIKASKHVI